MKKPLLVALVALGLGACQKDNDAAPAAVGAPFDQEFTLDHNQQASLPVVSPELKVTVSDVLFSFCPKNAMCIAPDYVAPVLQITDAQGHAQQLTMPRNLFRNSSNPNWIDTASVRANNRRYLFTYINWKVGVNTDFAQKKDISVVLRVTRK
jgi:hypothetical protein